MIADMAPGVLPHGLSTAYAPGRAYVWQTAVPAACSGAGLTGGDRARNVNTPRYPGRFCRALMRAWPPGRAISSTEPGVTREQAHVPAEQPPSCEDAWLPAAHADQGRARDSGRPAP